MCHILQAARARLDDQGFGRKILLVVAVPLLALVALMSVEMSERYTDLQEAKRWGRTVATMRQLEDLVTALQQERGLSAGFVASGGRQFGAALLGRRRVVDTQVQALRLSLKGDDGMPLPFSDEALSRLENRFTGLSALRQAVTEGKEDAFHAYSRTNYDLLGLAEGLARQLPHTMIGHQIGGHLALQWVVEAAGKERGIVNRVLSSGLLSRDDASDLAKNQADQQHGLRRFGYLATEQQRGRLHRLKQGVSFTRTDHYRALLEGRSTTRRLAVALQSEFGRGGLTDLFRRYLHEGAPRQRAAFERKGVSASTQLAALRASSGLSVRERKILDLAEQMLAGYRRGMERIASLRSKGWTVAQIEPVVRLDDSNVFRDLGTLGTGVSERLATQWWQASSDRLTRLAALSNSIREEIEQQAHGLADAALGRLILHASLFIFVLCFTSAIGFLVWRRTIPLQQVTRRLNAMASGHYQSDRLAASGLDEIGALQRAFNALLDGLGRLTERGELLAEGTARSATVQVEQQVSSPGLDLVGPLAEALATVERKHHLLVEQALVIAHHELNAPVLDQEVTGDLGLAFAEMKHNLRTLARQARAVQRGHLDDPALEIRVAGELGTAFANMVTDLRSMQDQLSMAERMSSMGMLAAGIGHEINNPMSYIMGGIQYTAEVLRDEGGDPDLIEVLDDAFKGTQRVRAICRDLNMFSQSQQTEPGPVDVVAVMQSAVRLAWSHINGRATLRESYGEVQQANGIPGRLGQVFLNLLINAAQALPDDRADNVIEVHVSQKDERVLIQIRDNGPGVPDEIAEQIFRPFFTTKPPGEGTGLGLAICHQIINRLGGELRLEREGPGATFTVELLAVSGILPPEGTCSDEYSGAGLNALVIDDEPLVCKAVGRLLQGWNLSLVGSGAEAFEVLAAQTPDIILCDMVMPNMTGRDVYLRLREDHPQLASRVIFMTGGVHTTELLDFLEATELVVLHKPVEASELRKAIQCTLPER